MILEGKDGVLFVLVFSQHLVQGYSMFFSIIFGV